MTNNQCAFLYYLLSPLLAIPYNDFFKKKPLGVVCLETYQIV